MRNSITLLLRVVLVSILVISCTKEGLEGPTGPRGEQGIQGEKGDAGEAIGVAGRKGEQGEPGEDGSNGQDGADGNANVITETMVLTNDDWLWGGQWNSFQNGQVILISTTRYVDLNVPELTKDIEDNGMVLLFVKPSANSSWQPMPYRNELGDFSENILYETSSKKIRIHFTWLGSGRPPSNVLESLVLVDYPIKYVLVEGADIENNNLSINQLKYMSYDDISNYLDLKE